MWNKTSHVVFWASSLLSLSAAAGEVVTADQVDAAILQASLESGVDHDLLRAIATVESNRNAKAIGGLGEVGLFQLRPEFFGGAASTDPIVNATTAAKYLAKLKRQCASYGKAFFVCHNTGAFRKQKLKRPTEFVYYKKVMAAMPPARTLASQP
jgi:soluble lytic murein transglycosylase-like protein